MSDDFIEEESIGEDALFTPRQAVLKGNFALSNFSVPYYQANLTFDEVLKHLMLVEDMPSDQRHKWSLEELFQRDINWQRVEEDIVVNYLKRSEKRTFFNALTVALLPLADSGKLGKQYEDIDYPLSSAQPFNNSSYKQVRVGGVQVAYKSENASNIQ